MRSFLLGTVFAVAATLAQAAPTTWTPTTASAFNGTLTISAVSHGTFDLETGEVTSIDFGPVTAVQATGGSNAFSVFNGKTTAIAWIAGLSGSTGLVTGESYSLTQNVLKLSYTAGSTTSTFLLDIYKMTINSNTASNQFSITSSGLSSIASNNVNGNTGLGGVGYLKTATNTYAPTEVRVSYSGTYALDLDDQGNSTGTFQGNETISIQSPPRSGGTAAVASASVLHAIPEPASLAFVGFGLAALGLVRRRTP